MMRAMRLLSIALPLALAAALPTGAGAQEQDTVPAPRRRGPLFEPLAGVRLGFPQKLSAHVGVALVQERTEYGYTGWALTVEPGLGGGLVGIGPTGSGGIGMTGRMQAALLRTWGDPWLVGPDQTYVGADARFTIGYIGFAIGGYLRVPEEGADPGILLSAGLVLGL
jgi:hypothetical protein